MHFRFIILYMNLKAHLEDNGMSVCIPLPRFPERPSLPRSPERHVTSRHDSRRVPNMCVIRTRKMCEPRVF